MRAGARWRATTGAGLLAGALLAAACVDRDVRTLSARTAAPEVIPPSEETATPTRPEVPPQEPPVDSVPGDDGPEFTLPDLTFPEPPSSGSTEPAGTESEGSGPAGTAPAGSAPPPGTESQDDLASAGDDLYPEVGNGDIDVEHYVVRVAYDPARPEIAGHVTVTATATTTVRHIVLDASAMEIDGVAVGGQPARWEKRPDELVVLRPVAAGEPFTVDVTYRDEPGTSRGAFGLDAGWFATPTGSYVLNEPDALRSWMPADDHPGDKATWRFEITVPDGLTGVANGELVEERAGDGATTWVWEQTEPMSPYLVQLLTGRYSVLNGGSAGSVPLVNVALAADVRRMQPYFAETAGQIAFFERHFGPYPLDRYGLAFTESFGGLAMETQGRSMFSRADFPGGSPGDGEQMLLSHELAHQWFGNAVSPADWSDLWLNESFASYAQWMWFDEIGLNDIDASARAALDLRRQMSREPTGSPSVDNLFGYERYDGGAVVLHALRGELASDDAFFGLLQRWVAENDGTSRTSEDFIALAEDVAGRPLTEFFADWLFATDLPDDFPT